MCYMFYLEIMDGFKGLNGAVISAPDGCGIGLCIGWDYKEKEGVILAPNGYGICLCIG